MGICMGNLPDGCTMADIDEAAGDGLCPPDACDGRPEGSCELCWLSGNAVRARWHREGDMQALCLYHAAVQFLDGCEGAFLPALLVTVNREFAVTQSIQAQKKQDVARLSAGRT